MNTYNPKTALDLSGREIDELTHDEVLDMISSHYRLIFAKCNDEESTIAKMLVNCVNTENARFIETLLYLTVMDLLIRRGELDFVDGQWRIFPLPPRSDCFSTDRIRGS